MPQKKIKVLYPKKSVSGERPQKQTHKAMSAESNYEVFYRPDKSGGWPSDHP